MISNQKLVISGNFLELYNYEVPFFHSYKRNSRQIKKCSSSLERKFFSINRCRQKIRRIVNSNPNLKKFLTLTFADNVSDLDTAHLQFKLFLEKIRKEKDNFQYIAVVEFQKRGAVHYHILCNLQYMKADKISDLWGNGFIKINRIDNIENLGAYVSKYLQKNIVDKRLNGRKAYFTSRKINRPLEVVDNSLAKKIIACYNLSNKKPLKEYSYFNEYTGQVSYRIFKI